MSRWTRVKEIFHRAVALETGREEYLREACGDDVELLTEVRKMLAGDQGEDTVLDTVAASTLGIERPAVGPGHVLGRYRLLERIGQGGMGEVWLAEQHEPVRRKVAVKIIKRGMDSARVSARFEAERQALALMEHEAIARVFDGGTTPRGRPFFVMEYVAGVPITRYCDHERLTTRERIDLFLRVCEGVQHAHLKGIIHRDIKPSNVLVTTLDGRAVPKIIDFGVAKAMDQPLTDRTLHTQLGVLIGTPEYMSPEQADFTSHDIDTRSDVYSLGVLLYELLVGALPFDPRNLRASSFDEIRRQIREIDPPTPSRRLSTLGGERTASAATARRTELPLLRRQLRGDLDWITMRALAKERSRRYASPSELAADLRRHLAHEPVLAGPPSTIYRTRKFVRRHRSLVAFAAVLGLSLVTFVIAHALQASRIARQKDDLQQVVEFQEDQLSQLQPRVMGEHLRETLLDEVRDALERKEAGAIDTAIAELDMALEPANFTTVAVASLEKNFFDRALVNVETRFADQPLVRARLLQSLAGPLYKVGLRERAVAVQAEALRLRRQLLGSDDLQTLDSIQRLAVMERFWGARLDQAEALFREAFECRRRALGEDHPQTLESLAWYARVLSHASPSRDSTRKDGRALALDAAQRSAAVLGASHPVAIRAQLYYAQTADVPTLEEKTAELRRAYDTSMRALGPDDPLTMEAALSLGIGLYRARRLDEAEPFLRQSMTHLREFYGDHEDGTLEATETLAVLLEISGRLDEALELSNRLVEERVFRGEETKMLLARHNRAFVLYKLGRLAEAESEMRDVLEARRRRLGEDGSATINTMRNLALVVSARGRVDEAEALAREAVERSVRRSGPDHNQVGACRGALGRVLTAARRFAEAERELLEAYRILLASFGPESGAARRVAGYLSEMYEDWDETDQGAEHGASARQWRDRT